MSHIKSAEKEVCGKFKRYPLKTAQTGLRQNKTTERKLRKWSKTTRAVAVLVRWQVVLVLLLCCRALQCVEGGGVVSSFCLYFFFFFCIRWIRSRAHGLESVLTPRSSVLSTHMPQLERTRAAPDVTTRRTSGDAREGRGPGLIIYGTHLSSCYTSRNGGCLFSLTVKHGDLH